MSMFSAIKLVLTLRCEESSRLTSASFDRELSRSERTAVGLHAFICRYCRRYRRQINFLRDALRHRSTDLLSAPESARTIGTLSPAARERIQLILTRNHNA